MIEFNILDWVIVDEQGHTSLIYDKWYDNVIDGEITLRYQIDTDTIWGMKAKGWISAEIINELNKHTIRDKQINSIIR